MSIKYSPVSQKHYQMFQSKLAHLMRVGHVQKDLTPHPNPLPVYQLRLLDVMHDDRSRLAKHVAWRYFAKSESTDQVVSGDFDLATRPQVTRLSYGDWPKETLRAAKAVKSHLHLQAHENEPRLLRIPSLLVEALWFRPVSQKSSDEEIGWIVPYHTLLRDLEPYEPYPIKDMFPKLVQFAEKTTAGWMKRP